MVMRSVLINFDEDEPSLAALVKMVPTDTPLEIVKVGYAGCGTHSITLEWDSRYEPEPF